MSDASADEDVRRLCDYLRTLRDATMYSNDEYGGFTDEQGNYYADDSAAADVAREWASALLDAANANGMYGCPLCKS